MSCGQFCDCEKGAGRRDSNRPKGAELKVLVLAGGRSAERDVSLASGAAVSEALVEAGCEVRIFDPGVSSGAVEWTAESFDSEIGTAPPDQDDVDGGATSPSAVFTPADLVVSGADEVDVVMIALHGGDGENGHLQALLDSVGVPYAGSGMLASALAMDKQAAKRMFTAEGIPTPNWQMIDRREMPDYEEMVEALGSPLVVKPNAQGSTVGLSIVGDATSWSGALSEGFRWDDQLLIEEFIAGRELTVAILGENALPVIEITPSHGIYDYECKYTSGRSNYVCPADLPSRTTVMLQQQALAAFAVLGCRGFGRVDFRMSDDGMASCLEVNTLPGMTKTSLVPMAAAAAGIGFPQLVKQICELGMLKSARSRSATPVD